MWLHPNTDVFYACLNILDNMFFCLNKTAGGHKVINVILHMCTFCVNVLLVLY